MVWEQVDWVIPVRTAENELQVLVESKNVLIGSVFISPEDVRELPMNPNQTREVGEFSVVDVVIVVVAGEWGGGGVEVDVLFI